MTGSGRHSVRVVVWLLLVSRVFVLVSTKFGIAVLVTMPAVSTMIMGMGVLMLVPVGMFVAMLVGVFGTVLVGMIVFVFVLVLVFMFVAVFVVTFHGIPPSLNVARTIQSDSYRLYRPLSDSMFLQESGLAQRYHPAVEGTQERPPPKFGLETFVQQGVVFIGSAVIRIC